VALPARDGAAPAPNARFELASAPTAAGGTGVDEPKVYVLRVKRGSVTAQAN
jgi:hypothetical protein